MDSKIKIVILIFFLCILFLLSKALLNVSEEVISTVGIDTTETGTGDKNDNESMAMTNGSKNSKMWQEVELTKNQAAHLATLPLKCIQNPLPYKSGIVIQDSSDLAMPQEHHPAFYGCFDWHSAVHGHWSLIYLLKQFPDLASANEIRRAIDSNLTKENIDQEIAYFSLNDYTKNYERTYGWAWLLKLSAELYTWDDPDAKKWYKTLEPLNRVLSEKYQSYLPKLVFPIRVGTHSNTAFGLTFAHDYAVTVGDTDLQNMIESRARDFYFEDKGCPISWEPSGYDFLSPCLEELDIMRRVLSKDEFAIWKNEFLQGLQKGDIDITPADVKDRSDGHLVHLDGVNFSRAWCLYSVSEGNPEIVKIADEHYNYSINKIVDGDYMGEHWLASFALYALQSKSNSTNISAK